MQSGVAVVIPSLNEERSIGGAVSSAWAAGAEAVIVSDGGSDDDTVPLAQRAGARVVAAARIRGAQLNAGARESAAPVLLFLHADTILPEGACAAAAEAIADGAVLGAFRISFRETAWRLHLVAAMINARCAITREPWGDQAQFVARNEFDRTGGFREWPIMEDYEFARRQKSRGRVAILPSAVSTSGRRFLERGVLRTMVTNWRVIAAFESGVSPEKLAAIYRS